MIAIFVLSFGWTVTMIEIQVSLIGVVLSAPLWIPILALAFVVGLFGLMTMEGMVNVAYGRAVRRWEDLAASRIAANVLNKDRLAIMFRLSTYSALDPLLYIYNLFYYSVFLYLSGALVAMALACIASGLFFLVIIGSTLFLAFCLFFQKLFLDRYVLLLEASTKVPSRFMLEVEAKELENMIYKATYTATDERTQSKTLVTLCHRIVRQKKFEQRARDLSAEAYKALVINRFRAYQSVIEGANKWIEHLEPFSHERAAVSKATNRLRYLIQQTPS
jgi:hypothetical protein